MWGGSKGRGVGQPVTSSVWGLKQYSEGGKSFLRNRDLNAAVNITLIYISLRDEGVVPYRFRDTIILKKDVFNPPSCNYKYKLAKGTNGQEKFERLKM